MSSHNPIWSPHHQILRMADSRISPDCCRTKETIKLRRSPRFPRAVKEGDVSEDESSSENDIMECMSPSAQRFEDEDRLRAKPDQKESRGSPRTQAYETGGKPRTQQITLCVILLAILAGIVIIVAVVISQFLEPRKECGCTSTLEAVMSDFTHQSKDLWPSVMSVLDGEQSSVHSIILLHLPEDGHTAECLATQLARTFACQRRETEKFVTIKPSEINVYGDYGDVLEWYREVPGAGAVVILNPNLIKGEKAQIFHTMCDDVTVLNPPSLYIFTLPVPRNQTGKPNRLAREILQKAWGNLSHNILDPLLARVLGHVITVKSEETLPCQL